MTDSLALLSSTAPLRTEKQKTSSASGREEEKAWNSAVVRDDSASMSFLQRSGTARLRCCCSAGVKVEREEAAEGVGWDGHRSASSSRITSRSAVCSDREREEFEMGERPPPLLPTSDGLLATFPVVVPPKWNPSNANELEAPPGVAEDHHHHRLEANDDHHTTDQQKPRSSCRTSSPALMEDRDHHSPLSAAASPPPCAAGAAVEVSALPPMTEEDDEKKRRRFSAWLSPPPAERKPGEGVPVGSPTPTSAGMEGSPSPTPGAPPSSSSSLKGSPVDGHPLPPPYPSTGATAAIQTSQRVPTGLPPRPTPVSCSPFRGGSGYAGHTADRAFAGPSASLASSPPPSTCSTTSARGHPKNEESGPPSFPAERCTGAGSSSTLQRVASAGFGLRLSTQAGGHSTCSATHVVVEAAGAALASPRSTPPPQRHSSSLGGVTPAPCCWNPVYKGPPSPTRSMNALRVIEVGGGEPLSDREQVEEAEDDGLEWYEDSRVEPSDRVSSLRCQHSGKSSLRRCLSQRKQTAALQVIEVAARGDVEEEEGQEEGGGVFSSIPCCPATRCASPTTAARTGGGVDSSSFSALPKSILTSASSFLVAASWSGGRPDASPTAAKPPSSWTMPPPTRQTSREGSITRDSAIPARGSSTGSCVGGGCSGSRQSHPSPAAAVAVATAPSSRAPSPRSTTAHHSPNPSPTSRTSASFFSYSKPPPHHGRNPPRSRETSVRVERSPSPDPVPPPPHPSAVNSRAASAWGGGRSESRRQPAHQLPAPFPAGRPTTSTGGGPPQSRPNAMLVSEGGGRMHRMEEGAGSWDRRSTALQRYSYGSGEGLVGGVTPPSFLFTAVPHPSSSPCHASASRTRGRRTALSRSLPRDEQESEPSPKAQTSYLASFERQEHCPRASVNPESPEVSHQFVLSCNGSGRGGGEGDHEDAVGRAASGVRGDASNPQPQSFPVLEPNSFSNGSFPEECTEGRRAAAAAVERRSVAVESAWIEEGQPQPESLDFCSCSSEGRRSASPPPEEERLPDEELKDLLEGGWREPIPGPVPCPLRSYPAARGWRTPSPGADGDSSGTVSGRGGVGGRASPSLTFTSLPTSVQFGWNGELWKQYCGNMAMEKEYDELDENETDNIYSPTAKDPSAGEPQVIWNRLHPSSHLLRSGEHSHREQSVCRADDDDDVDAENQANRGGDMAQDPCGDNDAEFGRRCATPDPPPDVLATTKKWVKLREDDHSPIESPFRDASPTPSSPPPSAETCRSPSPHFCTVPSPTPHTSVQHTVLVSHPPTAGNSPVSIKTEKTLPTAVPFSSEATDNTTSTPPSLPTSSLPPQQRHHHPGTGSSADMHPCSLPCYSCDGEGQVGAEVPFAALSSAVFPRSPHEPPHLHPPPSSATLPFHTTSPTISSTLVARHGVQSSALAGAYRGSLGRRGSGASLNSRSFSILSPMSTAASVVGAPGCPDGAPEANSPSSPVWLGGVPYVHPASTRASLASAAGGGGSRPSNVVFFNPSALRQEGHAVASSAPWSPTLSVSMDSVYTASKTVLPCPAEEGESKEVDEHVQAVAAVSHWGKGVRHRGGTRDVRLQPSPSCGTSAADEEGERKDRSGFRPTSGEEMRLRRSSASFCSVPMLRAPHAGDGPTGGGSRADSIPGTPMTATTTMNGNDVGVDRARRRSITFVNIASASVNDVPGSGGPMGYFSPLSGGGLYGSPLDAATEKDSRNVTKPCQRMSEIPKDFNSHESSPDGAAGVLRTEPGRRRSLVSNHAFTSSSSLSSASPSVVSLKKPEVMTEEEATRTKVLSAGDEIEDDVAVSTHSELLLFLCSPSAPLPSSHGPVFFCATPAGVAAASTVCPAGEAASIMDPVPETVLSRSPTNTYFDPQGPLDSIRLKPWFTNGGATRPTTTKGMTGTTNNLVLSGSSPVPQQVPQRTSRRSSSNSSSSQAVLHVHLDDGADDDEGELGNTLQHDEERSGCRSPSHATASNEAPERSGWKLALLPCGDAPLASDTDAGENSKADGRLCYPSHPKTLFAHRDINCYYAAAPFPEEWREMVNQKATALTSASPHPHTMMDTKKMVRHTSLEDVKQSVVAEENEVVSPTPPTITINRSSGVFTPPPNGNEETSETVVWCGGGRGEVGTVKSTEDTRQEEEGVDEAANTLRCRLSRRIPAVDKDPNATLMPLHSTQMERECAGWRRRAGQLEQEKRAVLELTRPQPQQLQLPPRGCASPQRPSPCCSRTSSQGSPLPHALRHSAATSTQCRSLSPLLPQPSSPVQPEATAASLSGSSDRSRPVLPEGAVLEGVVGTGSSSARRPTPHAGSSCGSLHPLRTMVEGGGASADHPQHSRSSSFGLSGTFNPRRETNCTPTTPSVTATIATTGDEEQEASLVPQSRMCALSTVLTTACDPSPPLHNNHSSSYPSASATPLRTMFPSITPTCTSPSGATSSGARGPRPATVSPLRPFANDTENMDHSRSSLNSPSIDVSLSAAAAGTEGSAFPLACSPQSGSIPRRRSPQRDVVPPTTTTTTAVPWPRTLSSAFKEFTACVEPHRGEWMEVSPLGRTDGNQRHDVKEAPQERIVRCAHKGDQSSPRPAATGDHWARKEDFTSGVNSSGASRQDEAAEESHPTTAFIGIDKPEEKEVSGSTRTSSLPAGGDADNSGSQPWVTRTRTEEMRSPTWLSASTSPSSSSDPLRVYPLSSVSGGHPPSTCSSTISDAVAVGGGPHRIPVQEEDPPEKWVTDRVGCDLHEVTSHPSHRASAALCANAPLLKEAAHLPGVGTSHASETATPASAPITASAGGGCSPSPSATTPVTTTTASPEHRTTQRERKPFTLLSSDILAAATTCRAKGPPSHGGSGPEEEEGEGVGAPRHTRCGSPIEEQGSARHSPAGETSPPARSPSFTGVRPWDPPAAGRTSVLPTPGTPHPSSSSSLLRQRSSSLVCSPPGSRMSHASSPDVLRNASVVSVSSASTTALGESAATSLR